jgi:hypothetical protein
MFNKNLIVIKDKIRKIYLQLKKVLAVTKGSVTKLVNYTFRTCIRYYKPSMHLNMIKKNILKILVKFSSHLKFQNFDKSWLSLKGG